MAEYVTYPLNEIDYSADDAQLYTATRRHGVYANDHFNATVTGVDNSITIAPGIAWASPSEWGGVVFASKTPVLVNLPLADPSQPRYDLITIKFNASTGFEGEISYTEGTPSSNPQIPPVSQNSNIFELGLFSVYRPVGATTITAGNVGDLRTNDTYCGLMRDGVTGIDTSVLNAQALALIEDLKKVIAEIIDGSQYMLKAEYDPNADGIDVTNQLYTHTALSILIGTGANGYFKSMFSGTVASITIGGTVYTVKNGTSTSINLTANTVYSFILIDNTINFAGAGGGGLTLIWENASPLSAFPKQDISLNTSNYDYIEVHFLGEATLIHSQKIELTPISDEIVETTLNSMRTISDVTLPQVPQIRFEGRRVEISPTLISFYSGVFFRPQYSTESIPNIVEQVNTVCKPVKIYGGNY